jgi:hypothetical protein
MAFRNPISTATELIAYDPASGNRVVIEPSGSPSILLGVDDPAVGSIFGFLDGRGANDLATDGLVDAYADLGVQLPEQTAFGLQPQIHCWGAWQSPNVLPDRGVTITGPVEFDPDSQSNLSPNVGITLDPTNASKLGIKAIAFGTNTPTTNASGVGTITYAGNSAWPFTPQTVLLTITEGGGIAARVGVQNITTSTFTFTLRNFSGALMASTAVTVHWAVIAWQRH